jgi:NADH:ubiquinone oxidoreductase subunit B-like Fe-S oxidoreductase
MNWEWKYSTYCCVLELSPAFIADADSTRVDFWNITSSQ